MTTRMIASDLPDARGEDLTRVGVSPLVGGVTVGAVVVVAVIAAVVSYSHMQQLAAHAGEAWRSWLIPLSIDGLVVAASMVLVTARRTGHRGGHLAWAALGGGVAASVAANMAEARAGVTAVLVAGWPAVAFALAFELLLRQRRAQNHTMNPPPQPTPQPEPTPESVSVPGDHQLAAPTPVTAAPVDPVEGLRELVGRSGRMPGRRVVARELGITEHHARTVLAQVAQPINTQGSVSGTGDPR